MPSRSRLRITAEISGGVLGAAWPRSGSATRATTVWYGVSPSVVAGFARPTASAISSKRATRCCRMSRVGLVLADEVRVGAGEALERRLTLAGWYFERTAPELRDLEERRRGRGRAAGRPGRRSASSVRPGGSSSVRSWPPAAASAARLQDVERRRGRPCSCGACRCRPGTARRPMTVAQIWNASDEPITPASLERVAASLGAPPGLDRRP